MNELASLLINHDIPQMAISQSHDIPNNAVYAKSGNEVLDVVIPQLGVHKSLQKEIMEHWSELFRDRLVQFETLLLVLLPDPLKLLQNRSVFDLSRMIATMGRSLLCALPMDQKRVQTPRIIDQIIANREGVSHILQHSNIGSDTYDFVCAKKNLIDFLRYERGIILNLAEKLVEQLEQLLNHTIRSDFVSFDHLNVLVSLYGETTHLPRRCNTSRHHRKRRSEVANVRNGALS